MANRWGKFFPWGRKRKYEGAAKTKRTSRWRTQSTSANSEVAMGITTLRDRARDLRRNNPYAAKAIMGISSNVVGLGIQTQFRGEGKEVGGENPIEQKWKDWTSSLDFDFDGRHNFFGIQSLIMEAIAESGEVLVRKRYDTSKAFPLQYQVLESDFLDTNKSEAKLENGNSVVQGIEFNKQGKRVAYYLFESHPGGYDQIFFTSTLKSNRVPADQILHIYRMDRPGQARGITWLAPCILRIKDFDDYEDAQLVRQKIAACFTAFVRDIDGSVEAPEEPCDDDLGDKIEPALIEHLPPGKSIEFTNPPGVQNYDEYTTKLLQGIATGVGVTYELLTGDYSKVNFSSARMGWIEFQRFLQKWRTQILIPHLLEPCVKDFFNVVTLMGMDPTGLKAAYMPPKREMIDPTKEVPATIEALRGGLTTWSDEIMSLGKDPEEHFTQYQKDQQMLDGLKILLESDPRFQKQAAGAPQQGGTNEPQD